MFWPLKEVKIVRFWLVHKTACYLKKKYVECQAGAWCRSQCWCWCKVVRAFWPGAGATSVPVLKIQLGFGAAVVPVWHISSGARVTSVLVLAPKISPHQAPGASVYSLPTHLLRTDLVTFEKLQRELFRKIRQKREFGKSHQIRA